LVKSGPELRGGKKEGKIKRESYEKGRGKKREKKKKARDEEASLHNKKTGKKRRSK